MLAGRSIGGPALVDRPTDPSAGGTGVRVTWPSSPGPRHLARVTSGDRFAPSDDFSTLYRMRIRSSGSG